ncbi:MAG: potassium channel family protein [Aestuariivirgaceae bacterium]|nr:potassium channel family protein [Aestuariivirgaceae bacterium]
MEDILGQLLIGSGVIALIVGIHAEMLNLLSVNLDRIITFARHRLHRFANTGVIIVSMLFILLTHTIEVWVWACVLLLTGAVQGLEPALYFALVCFTTVGFGDIILVPEWRLLSALIAANGFLLFGWSTAYMVEMVRRTA